jgi:hypothetical protein
MPYWTAQINAAVMSTPPITMMIIPTGEPEAAVVYVVVSM